MALVIFIFSIYTITNYQPYFAISKLWIKNYLKYNIYIGKFIKSVM